MEAENRHVEKLAILENRLAKLEILQHENRRMRAMIENRQHVENRHNVKNRQASENRRNRWTWSKSPGPANRQRKRRGPLRTALSIPVVMYSAFIASQRVLGWLHHLGRAMAWMPWWCWITILALAVSSIAFCLYTPRRYR